MFYFMCELEHTKLGKSKRRKKKKTKKEKSINERQDKSWRMTMYGFVWLKNIASLCSAVLDEISWTKLWREKRRKKKKKQTANGEYNALIVIVMIRVCGCRHKIYSLFAARYSAIHYYVGGVAGVGWWRTIAVARPPVLLLHTLPHSLLPIATMRYVAFAIVCCAAMFQQI